MLWRKVFRDLKENKGTYIASIVIITIGLMVFTSFSIMVDNLHSSQQSFYKDQNFADGFAEVVALPFSDLDRLDTIEGISEIEGRMVKDVRVLFPNRTENVFLRLVSINPNKAHPINGIHLTQGIPLNDREMNIWLDDNFFEANKLSLNDEIEIIAAGKKVALTIAGIGKSPEFIYALQSIADIYPTPETFGIAFVPLEIMKTLFPQDNAYNDLIFTLEPHTSFDDIKEQLEYQLKPYGLVNLIPRDDQISHLLVTQEIESLEAMSTALPVLFLSIAAIILYITLKRLVEQQRGQIGILKALGYTHKEIIFHYMSYSIIVGFVGSILGGLCGTLLSFPLTNLFEEFFNMPGLAGDLSLKYMVYGILLALLFSLIAGYQGCKKVLSLEPAEAMRPPAPPLGKKVLLEKVKVFWNMLTVQGMMAVRNMSRNKGRTAFIFFGIMICFSISAFTWSMNDFMQKMVFDQYEKIEVYDLKITLSTPLDEEKVTRELEKNPGVKKVEAMAELPITIKHNWHEVDTVLLGIPKDSQLYNILDNNYNKILPPNNGLLLSERLAKLLDAEVGTSVVVESPIINNINQERMLEVAGIIPQYVGVNAYMELGGVQEFFQQRGLATALMLNVEADKISPLQEKYIESEMIASIDERSQRVEQLNEMMESYGSMIYIYALIGIVIGFAIIYSSSVITLSERSRELASMMVLGMTPAEVLSVITFEQWFIGIFAMVAGIPLSLVMLTGISEAISSDVFTIPATMSFTSIILAFLITSISIWIAQKFAAKKIKNLSLVEVLKSRE